MSCRCFTEDDFSRGELTEEMRELLSPDQRGDDGEDDFADIHDPEGRDRDWHDYNVARAANPRTYRDHVGLLRTGGRSDRLA